ncbi:MAG: AAA family ATPase [Acidobacteria bacterium]|nr:AAA family ATPase [Acidobacteriota bacterium]
MPDLQPTEVVGFQMNNPATGQLSTEFGPMASAEIILLDEINRIPLKSQSAFLEGLQDRTITVGKETCDLPAFSFAIATMNPVELGRGTFPLSEAATDRFAAMVQIGYLPWGLRILDKDEELLGPSPIARLFLMLSDGEAWSGEVARAIDRVREAKVPVFVGAALGLAALALLFVRSRMEVWLQSGLAVAALRLVVRLLG